MIFTLDNVFRRLYECFCLDVKMIKVMHYLFLSRLFIPILLIFFLHLFLNNRKDKIKKQLYCDY